MHWTWHQAFSEIICNGLTQEDIERCEAAGDAGWTDEVALAPMREGVFTDEPLDD